MSQAFLIKIDNGFSNGDFTILEMVVAFTGTDVNSVEQQPTIVRIVDVSIDQTAGANTIQQAMSDAIRSFASAKGYPVPAAAVIMPNLQKT